MPPGPPRLHDDEGGGVGPLLGPFHIGDRPTLHCEARGGEVEKMYFFFTPKREGGINIPCNKIHTVPFHIETLFMYITCFF